MLPFFGKAHVASIPADRIVGLFKLPRYRTWMRGVQKQNSTTLTSCLRIS